MYLTLTTVMQNILFHVIWYTLLHAQSMYACRTDDDVSSWCHVITMKYWPHENKQRHVVYIVCVIAIQHDFPTPPNFVPTIRKGGIMSRRRYTESNKYNYDYIYKYLSSRMNKIRSRRSLNLPLSDVWTVLIQPLYQHHPSLSNYLWQGRKRSCQ